MLKEGQLIRLPTPGGDEGDWGTILNTFLSQALDSNTGLIKTGSVLKSQLVSSVQTSLDAADNAIPSSQKGAASGVATLDGSTKLTAAQLPSNVATKSSNSGDTGKAIDAYTGSPLTIASASQTNIAWAASTTYSAGATVMNNGGLFQARRAHTSGSSFDRAMWRPIGLTPGYPGRQVATHGFRGADAGLSNGTNTGLNSRSRHYATCDIGTVRLVYWNSYNGTDGPDTITVRAAIERSSQYMRAYFNGVRDAVIPAGGVVISDPIPIDIADGDFFYCRTFVSATSGDMWPIYHVPNGLALSGSWSEGTSTSVGETDKTTSGSISGLTDYMFYPYMIVSQDSVASTTPCVGLVGDSIMVGANEGDKGFAIRALGDEVASLSVAESGSSIQFFATKSANVNRKTLMANCTHILCDFGINDIRAGGAGRTAEQVANDLLTYATYWMRRGIPFWQTTLTPNTNSSDSWATAGNQTFPGASNETQRTTFNSWIRAGAPIDPTTKVYVVAGTGGALTAGQPGHPFAGTFDTAATVEVNSSNVLTLNGGYWKAGYTSDGLHPSNNGHTDMATAVNVSQLTA